MSARMEAQIFSHSDAARFCGDSDSRKIGHNTYVERFTDTNGEDGFAIRYHSTDIVKFFIDGEVDFDFNGWLTRTTFDRVNNITQFSIFSEGSDEYGDPMYVISHPRFGDAPFYGRIFFDPSTGWEKWWKSRVEKRKSARRVEWWNR